MTLGKAIKKTQLLLSFANDPSTNAVKTNLEFILAAMNQAEKDINDYKEEIKSYRKTIKEEYAKREALDAQINTLVARIKKIENVVDKL